MGETGKALYYQWLGPLFQYPRRIEWWVRLPEPTEADYENVPFSILGGSSGG